VNRIPICNANRYTVGMAQLVTRVDDELLAQVDLVVTWSDLQNRSEFVRQALIELIDRKNRERIGRQIVEGYRNHPQTAAETAGTDQAAINMINEEPW
jgi:metal-responsive CopG/Arc/MetJ family transcriptional regulator